MVRLLIADDHALVRDCLRQVLSRCRDMAVAAEAANGQEVLEQLRCKGIDLVLLDMSMPGMSGVDLVKCIRQYHGRLPIVVFSMHDGAMFARSALAAGANGYLTKECGSEILVSAIRTVAAGGRYLDPGMVERLAYQKHHRVDELPHQALSAREQSILTLLASGLTVNAIAAELAISNKTVSCYKTRLMNKMNFANNAELMRYALAHHPGP